MRESDRLEVAKTGITPKRSLVYAFKNSFIHRTGLVDGEVAAMWGVVGQATSVIGIPYLLTGEVCNRMNPITFVRIYKQQLNEMNELFPELRNYVDSTYIEAVRLLKLVGFKLDEPDVKGFQVFKMSKEH